MEKQLIGLSLSFCISDIISGKVDYERVRFISTGTRIRNPEDWEEVAADYSKIYWRENPQAGIDLMLKFRDEGRLIQPRLEGQNPLPIHRGHWVDIETYREMTRK